ncbi:MAG TPA: hypothetical protein VLB01_08395 [Thermodesulfobacteriota bacterium]|nr:hypothetical protein [Thermodesulfobacteriota bacterium]
MQTLNTRSSIKKEGSPIESVFPHRERVVEDEESLYVIKSN